MTANSETSSTETPSSNRVDLPPDVAQWVTAYREARDQAAHWQTIADRAREHIEDALGEAEEGYVNGTPAVRWSYVNSTRVDVTKLQAERPDVADTFRVPTVTRRFTLAQP